MTAHARRGRVNTDQVLDQVLIEYLLPPDAPFTAELLLAHVSAREAILLQQMPSFVEAMALVLNALRELKPSASQLARHQRDALHVSRAERRALARSTVRDALADEPDASLSRLVTLTGYSRSYCAELRKEVRAETRD